MIETEITRYVAAKDVVIPYKTLETAAEEADDYKFLQLGNGHYACAHGDNTYVLTEKMSPDDVPVVGCSCKAWTFGHDADGCKHVAAFQKRAEKPTEKPSSKIVLDLLAAGWRKDEGDALYPPENGNGEGGKLTEREHEHTQDDVINATSDEDGEDNEGNDPVPDRAPKPTPEPKPTTPEPKPATGMIAGTCQWCGKKFERQNAANLKPIIEEHERTCPKRQESVGEATVAKDAPIATVSKTEIVETPSSERVYTHPDGTVFDSAEALLDYAEKQKTPQTAPQTAARRVRHKSMIKGISPRLQEIGRIAVGEKGGLSKSGKTRLPTKLDHFIFTTLNKDEDDRYVRDAAMMAMFEENCTEIPVRLLYNDIELNFPTFYAKYTRSGVKLRGDGENWTVYNSDGSREEVYDPNNERGFMDDPDVKPHGILTVLVEGQNSVGGVFKFRTTSWNSINNIMSSLALIKNMCGMLTYIPLKLVVRKKEVQPKGMAQKTWIPAVSVEFRGSIEELQNQAIEVRRLTTRAQQEEMRQIEAAVRDSLDDDETLETQRDVATEFAPGVV